MRHWPGRGRGGGHDGIGEARTERHFDCDVYYCPKCKELRQVSLPSKYCMKCNTKCTKEREW